MLFHPAQFALIHAETETHSPSAPPAASLPPATPEWRTQLAVLWRARRLVVLITLLCLAAAGLYVLAASPVYEANLLLQVEEERPNAVRNPLTEVSSQFDTKSAAIAEMELLRSRLVLGPTVDALRLDIEVTPQAFPLAALRRPHPAGGLAPVPLPGLERFAWGGEQAAVSRFDVPAPWAAEDFTLTALDDGHWRLSGMGQSSLLDGGLGQLATRDFGAGTLSIQVDQLQARPGTSFRLHRVSRARAIDKLLNTLQITEQGKQSGVIEVRLNGNDPERVTAILDRLGHEYLRQHLARKTEEAGKTLAFLDQQLPVLRNQLEQAEAHYNQFRSSHGTVNLDQEVRLGLEREHQAYARRAELQYKRLELLGRFTDAHPSVAALNAQLREAARDISEQEAHLRTLPLLEQQEARLARDVKVSQDLYTALLNTAQQLRVLSAGQVSNVRLVDAPTAPERPIRPNRPLVLALAAISGLLLGAVAALARQALRVSLEDPDQLEAALGARIVYARVPHSRAEAKRGRADPVLLAQSAPDDAAIESLRAFRAALLQALPRCRNRVVSLCGLHAGAGVHFVAANLASLTAAAGQRVLLIDADIRGGRLHHVFGMESVPGMCEVLAQTLPLSQAVCRQVRTGLDLLPSGAAMPALSDADLGTRFAQLLATVGDHYDLVLVATPPVPGRADALALARAAAIVFLLARAGRTSVTEVQTAVHALNQVGILPHGLVFNGSSSPPGLPWHA